jgi:hypothetical protein
MQLVLGFQKVLATGAFDNPDAVTRNKSTLWQPQPSLARLRDAVDSKKIGHGFRRAD